MSRNTLAALSATAVALSLPAGAHAGTLTLVNTTPFGPVPTFRAAPGEYNDLVVRRISEPDLRAIGFLDRNRAITLKGTGCRFLEGGEATCDTMRGADVHLGDMADRADVVVNGEGRVYGGSGDDSIKADAFGTRTLVYGEAGDDDVQAGGDGGQLADGGPGDDIVRSGGAPGNATGIGGPGDDVLINRFDSIGAASLDGGPGDDIATSKPSGFRTTIEMGAGDDIVVVDGEDTAIGDEGAHAIATGDGNDAVLGGVRDDTIDGGPGRDLVDVRSGGADTVVCGPGWDVVRHDPDDSIAADCETRLSS